jgi:hypothetical protein
MASEMHPDVVKKLEILATAQEFDSQHNHWTDGNGFTRCGIRVIYPGRPVTFPTGSPIGSSTPAVLFNDAKPHLDMCPICHALGPARDPLP